MFENLGIIVKQKTGILWLSVEFFIDCLTQYLSEPMQTLYIFLICQFRHCSTLSSSTAGIVWLSSYLLCLILKVILMAEFAWSRPMHVLKHFQSRLKFTFHYILSFYYTMYMYLSCVSFLQGGGGETIKNPFMEKEDMKHGQICFFVAFKLIKPPGADATE